MAAELFTYSDESGIDQDAQFLFVVGHIGSPRHWKSLTKVWRNILDAEGIETFHALDFFDKRRWRSSKNPYRGWDDARSLHFAESLADAIDSEQRIWPVGGGVDRAAFDELSPDAKRYITGATLEVKRVEAGLRARLITTGAPSLPYFSAFSLLVEEALNRAQDDVTVHFVFDRQEHYEGRAREFFREITEHGLLANRGGHKLGNVTYAPKKDYEELQAADLYAYTMRIGWQAQQGHSLHRITPELLAAYKILTRKRKGLIRIQNAESFRRVLDVNEDEDMKARGWRLG